MPHSAASNTVRNAHSHTTTLPPNDIRGPPCARDLIILHQPRRRNRMIPAADLIPATNNARVYQHSDILPTVHEPRCRGRDEPSHLPDILSSLNSFSRSCERDLTVTRAAQRRFALSQARTAVQRHGHCCGGRHGHCERNCMILIGT